MRKTVPFGLQKALKHHPEFAHLSQVGDPHLRESFGLLARTRLARAYAGESFSLRLAPCDAAPSYRRRLVFLYIQGSDGLKELGAAFALRSTSCAALHLIERHVVPIARVKLRPYLFKDLSRVNRHRRR